LPIVARLADVWNGEGHAATYARKSALLDELCTRLDRDPASLRRTVGLPPPLIRTDRAAAVAEQTERLARHGLSPDAARAASEASPFVGTVDGVAAALVAYADAGAGEVIFDWPAPADAETLEALAGPVRATLALPDEGH
jgi:hypothetical protein